MLASNCSVMVEKGLSRRGRGEGDFAGIHTEHVSEHGTDEDATGDEAALELAGFQAACALVFLARQRRCVQNRPLVRIEVTKPKMRPREVVHSFKGRLVKSRIWRFENRFHGSKSIGSDFQRIHKPLKGDVRLRSLKWPARRRSMDRTPTVG